MPRVYIPPPYRGPTGGEQVVEVEAASVRAALDAVDARFPGFSALIFTPEGGLHRFVKVFLNEDAIGPAALDTELGEADRVEVVAAIAGG